MLGISPQRHQFCRFIWSREARGSEYYVHCLFVYHTPHFSRATMRACPLSIHRSMTVPRGDMWTGGRYPVDTMTTV